MNADAHVVRKLHLHISRPDDNPEPLQDALAPVRQRLLWELSEAFDAACGRGETLYIDTLTVSAGRIERSGADWIWRDAGVFRMELRDRLADSRGGDTTGRPNPGDAAEPVGGTPWTAP